MGFGRRCALVDCTQVDQWEEGRVRRSSQAEVKGQVRLAHLLSVHRIELVIH